jgi:hypothetical protein
MPGQRNQRPKRCIDGQALGESLRFPTPTDDALWRYYQRSRQMPDIGRLTAWVDSSSIDMLAGLSK